MPATYCAHSHLLLI